MAIASALALLVLGPGGNATTYRNFKLPCLAPLLRQVDPEAPATVNLAFLRGPWRAPALRDDIGTVSFPITTQSKDAQRWFNQGVACIHGQANGEAERSFRQALLLDPSNPMIFWGLAVANEQRPGRAILFAENALRRIGNATTARERLWITALSSFYDLKRNRPAKSPPLPSRDGEPGLARHRQRIRDLEHLSLSYPDDVEAKAFLLRQLVLDLHRSGIKLTSHLAVDRLAEELASHAPHHPATHYRIFLWLREQPAQSLAHARSSASIAPGLADSWRFAAEGWRGSGRQHEAIALLQCALRVHHREMRDHLLMPVAVENLASNYAALGEALISMGRLKEALALADALLNLPRSLTAEGITGSSSELLLLGRRLHAQAELQAGRMEPVATLFRTEARFIPSPRSPPEMAQAHYWTGLALCALERPDEAQSLVQALEKMAERHKGDQRIRDWANGLRYFRILCSTGEPGKSLSPPHLPAGIHAAAWQKLNKPGIALQVARDHLAQNPRDLFATALYCSTGFETGNRVAVTRAFDRTFRQNVLRADKDLRNFPALDKVAAALSLPRRWTLPPGNLEKSGVPGDPGILGPAHWSPPSAPDWTLPNHAGRPVTLADFKGRAVLLNFFLGVSCPFCLSQLEKFRAARAAYRKAGIEMVAISSDEVKTLALRLGHTEEKTEEARRTFPFPVLADPGLEAFRSYHVFDEFEGGPMHGTFLIDPEGRILWSDIGHEPFNHAGGLLEEAMRLLPDHESDPQTPRDPS